MNITKIFTNYLFRVMTAWFGVYIMDKIKFDMKASTDFLFNKLNAAVDDVKATENDIMNKAGVVYLGTTENVQTVLDFFNTHDLLVGGVWYRYIGHVETSEVAGFDQQFGRLLDEDGHVSTSEVVYGNRRDYDDLAEGSTVYAGSTEQTVTEVRLPTQGYVNLTGFTEPLHVISGTLYMN